MNSFVWHARVITTKSSKSCTFLVLVHK